MKSTVPPIDRIFGRLTVIGLGTRKYYWSCKCSCGNEKEIAAYRVIHGEAKSCGCLRRETKRNLTGMRFGRLTVLRHVSERQTHCVCLCDCGSPEKTVPSRFLVSGESTSCGCYRLEQASKKNTKHGRTGSRIYRIWLAMMSRCLNPANQSFENYGGRGIRLCSKWQSFEAFYADMGEPGDNETIERIDNNGPYAPWNCKWATRAEQVRNRRNNVWITYKDKTMLLSDWAKQTGISAVTISYRIKAGWPLEKALFARHSKKKKEA